MSTKKKLSNGSLPTQTQNSKRFIRRNSFHTLNCRSGSLKKINAMSEELIASSPHLQNTHIQFNSPKNNKLEIQTENFFKQFSQPFEIPLKRSSGSMKIDHNCRQKKCSDQKYQNICKQLQMRSQQVQILSTQCKKLKAHLHEEKQKRKILQEQVRCNQQEIKRLEKRLDKYKKQKDKYEKQRDIIIKHIEELQQLKFNPQIKSIQGYRVKIMQDQVTKLRQQLDKSKSSREKQLMNNIDQLSQKKYVLENQLKAANVANIVLTKKMEQNDQEMQQIRQSVHKTVTSSYQYIELRQRYRRMLIQYKQLRSQMSMMQRENQSRSRILQSTLLTISQSGDMIYEI